MKTKNSKSRNDALVMKLTERECEILDNLLEYKTLKSIAMELGVTISAIDQRLKSARIKLGATDRNDAIRKYQGLLATCVEPTCRILQVPAQRQPELPPFAETVEAPAFMLRDSLPTSPDFETPVPAALESVLQNVEPAQTKVAPLSEVLDDKFGRLWRVVAIPIFALAIVMFALAILAMGKAMNQLF